MMTHWGRLWFVDSKVEKGMEVLTKVSENVEDAVVWEFVKT